MIEDIEKLIVEYANDKLKTVCTDFSAAKKEYDQLMAQKIHLRIKQLTSATSLEELIRNRIGRCHRLEDDRAGQYAMDLVGAWRLIFTRHKGKVQIVIINDIVDYHNSKKWKGMIT